MSTWKRDSRGPSAIMQATFNKVKGITWHWDTFESDVNDFEDRRGTLRGTIELKDGGRSWFTLTFKYGFSGRYTIRDTQGVIAFGHNMAEVVADWNDGWEADHPPNEEELAHEGEEV